MRHLPPPPGWRPHTQMLSCGWLVPRAMCSPSPLGWTPHPEPPLSALEASLEHLSYFLCTCPASDTGITTIYITFCSKPTTRKGGRDLVSRSLWSKQYIYKSTNIFWYYVIINIIHAQRKHPLPTLNLNTYVVLIPEHWYQWMLGAGNPKALQVNVVPFSHLTVAEGFSRILQRENTEEHARMTNGEWKIPLVFQHGGTVLI